MARSWRDREEQWQRFHEWEAAQLRERPDDFPAALAWMGEAWEIARRAEADWQSERSAEERWRHLREVRAALARGQGAS